MRHLTIIISVLFFSTITQGQKTHVDSSVYENGQLESKGLYYQVDNQSWQWGVWDYWYEDGKKKLELWSDTVKTRYINMWLQNGNQILKNGKGFYYEIEPDYKKNDSIIYQIQDSIKNGEARRYRSYNDSPYFLVETGYYENEKETGIWHFKDSVLKTVLLSSYKDGKQNGVEIDYFLNGKIKDSINYLNDRQDGNYKAYTENGILIKDCNYRNGYLIDSYKEYYTNGIIKVQGQYSQTKGYIKVNLVNASATGKMKVRTVDRLIDNKPLKQGVWKYYNSKGQLMKTEKYVNDKRI